MIAVFPLRKIAVDYCDFTQSRIDIFSANQSTLSILGIFWEPFEYVLRLLLDSKATP